MAVLYPADRGSWWAPSSASCFYCGQEVEGIAVLWVGSGEDLVLHPQCAEDLAVDLIGDAREAQLASGAHPWPTRAAPALRESLLASEGIDA